MIPKSQLAIILSQLNGFDKPKIRSEQYTTDPEIAAQILHHAAMLGDLDQKSVLDLGCGTGILTLGATLQGAHVTGVDCDPDALQIARNNSAQLKSEGLLHHAPEWVQKDIAEYSTPADTVITNPPFGTRVKHADRAFLDKALKLAQVAYFFAKTSTKEYISQRAVKSECTVTHCWDVKFGLPQTHTFHHKKRQYIEVSVLRIAKNPQK